MFSVSQEPSGEPHGLSTRMGNIWRGGRRCSPHAKPGVLRCSGWLCHAPTPAQDQVQGPFLIWSSVSSPTP